MENLKGLLNEEMSFIDLDNYMMRNGFYSVFDDGVTLEVKQGLSVAYTGVDSGEAEVKIDFEITEDNGVEDFYLVVNMISKL